MKGIAIFGCILLPGIGPRFGGFKLNSTPRFGGEKSAIEIDPSGIIDHSRVHRTLDIGVGGNLGMSTVDDDTNTTMNAMLTLMAHWTVCVASLSWLNQVFKIDIDILANV